jgi:Na+-driven multidrug efflux pump
MGLGFPGSAIGTTIARAIMLFAIFSYVAKIEDVTM